MLRFYWDTVCEIPRAVSKAALTYYAVGTLLLSAVGYLGIAWGKPVVGFWENLSPFWGAGVPVAVLAIWLLSVANFERFESLRIKNQALEEKVAGYQKSGAQEEIRRLYIPDSVPIPEDEPYVIEPPKYPGKGWPIICIAPYNNLEPAITVELKDAQDTYEVIVSYEVQSTTDPGQFSNVSGTMSIEARVWAIDEGGKIIRNLDFYRGTIDVTDDGSWQHAVSGRCTFVGLEGTYGFKVVDYTAMYGSRGSPRREYSNMHLSIVKSR